MLISPESLGVPQSTTPHFYIDINDNGCPSIKPDQIFTLNVNSLLTFKLFNGVKISNSIALISNTSNEFPHYEYLEGLTKSGKEIEKEDLKPFSLYPEKVNTNIYFTVMLAKPGLRQFSFLYYEPETNKYNLTKMFTILVNPKISLGDEKEITINQIQMQTVLSKNIGLLASDFENFFNECHLLNYNFIHFTAIQQLSSSNSVYTLKSHNEISDSFFEKPLSRQVKAQLFKQRIDQLKKEFGIASAIDIILNQASIESQDIISHPDSGYNLSNCPWLTVAYELDKILVEYSDLFYNKKVACKSAPYINNESDLEEAIDEIKKEIMKHNLEEFFLIPIDKYYDQFKAFFSKNKEEDKDYAMKRAYLLNELKENFNIEMNQSGSLKLSEEELFDLVMQSCTHYGEDRFGVQIEVEFVSMLIMEAAKANDPNSLNEFNFLKNVKRFVNKVNEEWTAKAKEMIDIAVQNVKEFIRYEFIQLKRTGVKRKLIDNYFNVIDKEDKKKIFLCNGWVMQNEDPTEIFPDITKYGTWYYFKRKVIVWPDTIKLNYGASLEETNKFLVEYLTEYVTSMAELFDGFVIDNILSIPIFALQFLISKAREVNPNLILIAQLPDGLLSNEVYYSNKLGVNLFTKEMIWCASPIEIADNIAMFGKGLNELTTQCERTMYDIQKEETFYSMKPYSYLQPTRPSSIIYDLTQDNQTYYEQYGNISLNLSMMSCLGLIDCAVASTRGYDQLFPFQPSSVNENRKYINDEEFEALLNELQQSARQKEQTKEIFFEFHPRNSENPFTKTVRLALSSNNWKPDISLTKINNNLFTARVSLPKGKYYYKYVLDGNIWTYDASQPMETDREKNVNNVLDICDDTKLLTNDLKLIRRDINSIRNELQKYKTEVYLHRDKDMICIIRMIIPGQRQSDIDYDGYCVICRPGYESSNNSIATKMTIPSEIGDFVCGCFMTNQSFEINKILSEKQLTGVKGNIYYTKDLNFLSSISTVEYYNGNTTINFHSILPNTVVILKLKNANNVRRAVSNLTRSIDTITQRGDDLIDYFDICDINSALFKTEPEEKDNTFNKRGLFKFDAPEGNHDYDLVYAGIYPIVKLLTRFKKENTTSMSNPLFDNIKAGNWLFEYILFRFSEIPSFKSLTQFLQNNIFAHYTYLYPHLRPLFFDKIITAVFFAIIKLALKSTPIDIINYGEFATEISLSRYQFMGHVISSSFNYSLGQKQININPNELKITVSRGLPNNDVGRYRFYARDTLVAFKSLFLIPKLNSEGKTILKMIAACLRHGMIPNLIDCGTKPRYNARDVSWLFIKAIKDYIEYTNEVNFLNEEIELIYTDDNIETHYRKKSRGVKRILSIADIIQDIFASTAKGIVFREYKAGSEIDHDMQGQGFNVTVTLDPLTGFVYGGNEYNCGTWMDKIGNSIRGHNKGTPATPRNGADIEIVALVYSALEFILSMSTKGYYKYKSVTLSNGVSYPFTQWKLRIKDNFESSFFISRLMKNCKENIYKDYLSESNDGTSLRNENQLRPNAIYAILSSPTLFTKSNVLKYIDNIERYLLSSSPSTMSLRTLDKDDSDYKGYFNRDDNGEYLTACGFNVHNGIEFVWLYAYYLLLKIEYTEWKSKDECRRFVAMKLLPMMKYTSRWYGLPEMMNEKGHVIGEGCQTHLMAVAGVYEVIEKIATM